ncbi:MAG: hypothetical protein GEU75_06690 [Dehalococcoidia bacterium]|nr:hypothetical protein [Dehalococcoidia bacterium]
MLTRIEERLTTLELGSIARALIVTELAGAALLLAFDGAGGAGRAILLLAGAGIVAYGLFVSGRKPFLARFLVIFGGMPVLVLASVLGPFGVLVVVDLHGRRLRGVGALSWADLSRDEVWRRQLGMKPDGN